MSENNAPLIPPIGRYDAHAVRVPVEGTPRWAQWQRATTGNINMLIHFEIDGPEEWATYVLPWFKTWTEKTQDQIIESLGHMGMVGDDLSKLEAEDLSKPISITVEHETKTRQDGTTYTLAKVGFVNRAGRGTVAFSQPMPESELAAFAATMRGTIKGARAAGPQRSNRPPASPARGSATPSNGNGGGRRPAGPERFDDVPPPGSYRPDDDLPF